MAKTHNGAKKNNYDIQIDHNYLITIIIILPNTFTKINYYPKSKVKLKPLPKLNSYTNPAIHTLTGTYNL